MHKTDMMKCIALLMILAAFSVMSIAVNIATTVPRTILISTKRSKPQEKKMDNHIGQDQNVIYSRGKPESYRKVGLIERKGGKDTKSYILPLYGRQTFPGSNRWNYATEMAHGVNFIKIPISNSKSKNCTELRGCKKLQKGNVVFVQKDKFRVLEAHIDFNF